MADPPIAPVNYVGRVTVVDIGDRRVPRGMSRRPVSICSHHALRYDTAERRIWCADCETTIDAFDAFSGLVGQFSAAIESLKARQKIVADAEAASLISIAAKNIDKLWRNKNHVPACPHCGNGLFPEHFRGSPSMLGRDYALAKLRKKEADHG